jgi:hypothetical protein
MLIVLANLIPTHSRWVSMVFGKTGS